MIVFNYLIPDLAGYFIKKFMTGKVPWGRDFYGSKKKMDHHRDPEPVDK
jgi:hypothetical protein